MSSDDELSEQPGGEIPRWPDRARPDMNNPKHRKLALELLNTGRYNELNGYLRGVLVPEPDDWPPPVEIEPVSGFLPPDPEWTVERTWVVNARSAGEAFRKTAATDSDYDRTYEGQPRPWEAP